MESPQHRSPCRTSYKAAVPILSAASSREGWDTTNARHPLVGNKIARMQIRLPLSIFGLVSVALSVAAQNSAPALLPPDDRYKADLLLIVAHPDDDVVIGGYLARIALDEHKRIAVVYCTNGDGGGNSVGNEAGASLGQMREIEARRALGAWGIYNVWFLSGHDTPGQNVLRSLDSWNHGRALDEVVRLVRITRPDVILTWLPDPVVGENHDDHQASSVLAVEAFDAAGDPTVFPEQVSPSRDRTGMANLTEGLLPWQPRKLYFFTDAFEDWGPYWHDPETLSPFRKTIVDHTGPVYETTTISPSRHKSYAELTAEQQAFYLTQEGDIGVKALKSGKFSDFEYHAHLIFGKSLVGGAVTGDVFDGVSPQPIPFARVQGYEPAHQNGLSFEIGDPWRFYELFWKAHNLGNLAQLIPVPEATPESGGKLTLDFLACNRSPDPSEIAIAPLLPAGWTVLPKFASYPVRAGECYPIQQQITAAPASKSHWEQLTWTASAGSQQIGSVTVRVFVGKGGGLPQ
jgi:LmbE family N-acetylglucosaminyl deacetylase